MKKSIYLISLSLLIPLLAQASINRLINPSKGNIIDIGRTNPINKADSVIHKDWVNISASLEEIDRSIYPKRRIEESHDCLSDEYGVSNCPIGLQTCQSNEEYSRGYSTPHREKIISEKVLKPNPYYLYNRRAGYSWPYSFLNLYAIPVGVYNFKFYAHEAGIYTVKVMTDNYSTVKIDGNIVHIDTSDHWTDLDTRYINLPIGEHNIYINAHNYAGPSGVAVAIYNPSGNCELNYTWYSYSCPSQNETPSENQATTWDESNPNGIWVGPLISTGGDCSEEGLKNGESCQSETPPNNNCLRKSFFCPADPNKLCTKIPNDLENGEENVDDRFIYDIGYSVEHKETLVKPKICPKGMTFNEEDNVCVEINSFLCLNEGFTYDTNLGECVRIPKCEGIVDENNNCITKAKVDCEEGYSYNQLTDKCEALPTCNNGYFNSTTNKCEENPSENSCPNGLSFSSLRNRCEKSPIDKKPKNLCPFINGIDTYNSSKKMCEYELREGFYGDWFIKPNIGILDSASIQIVSDKSYSARTPHNGVSMFNNGWKNNGKFAMKLYMIE